MDLLTSKLHEWINDNIDSLYHEDHQQSSKKVSLLRKGCKDEIEYRKNQYKLTLLEVAEEEVKKLRVKKRKK